MKTECVQNKIANGVQKSNLIISRSIDLPILSCVLITATDNQLLLQTTDIEHAITITISAKSEKTGSVAVDSEIFNHVVQNRSQDDVLSLEFKEQRLYINTKNSSSTISIQDHSEFPTIPHIEADGDSKHINLKTKEFIQGLQTVSFAASKSTIKAELSSVYVNYEAGRLYFVCTDGFRLIEQVYKIDLGLDEFSFLLPVKSAGIISKLFNSEDSINLFINDNQLAIQNENIYFTCRLLVGNFPDYKKLIPQEKETSVVVLKDDVFNVLKLSTVFSNEFHEVVLNIDPKNKLCELTSQNKDVGINQTNISGALEGDPLTVTFNHRFLSEVLTVLNTDSFELAFTDPGRPMKLTTVPESGLTYIVMPLNK